MRVALFGGTFDPIHRGHLTIATAAAAAFGLDQVLFAPTGRQPLKPESATASFADRLEMVRLAVSPVADLPPANCLFLASDLDEPHMDGSPNYTVDLLGTLERELPGATLFFLTGADSFLELRRWRSPDELLKLAEWIVVSRPGSTLTEEELGPLRLDPAQRGRVHLLSTVHEDVSATELRQRLGTGDSCAGLLPVAVETYIRSHNLYR